MSKYLTVNQFCEKHSWPSMAGLREYIYNSSTNGFQDCFLKVGGRVLVDEEMVFKIISQSKRVSDDKLERRNRTVSKRTSNSPKAKSSS
jgi:hypothetical protein